MVTLMIQVDENLLNYLTHEAEKVDKPIEEVAVTLLEKQASLSLETLAYNAKRSESNGLLMIALAAEALGDASQEDDIAERSREILQTDYIKHLLRYQDDE